MNALLLLAVAAAGGVGSALRYLTDNCLPIAVRRRFPWGTAAVNLIGSFVLGALTGASARWLPEVWLTILGTGLIGGYTTFSTASLETIQLARDRRLYAALLNGFGMLVGCVALALIGLLLFS